MQLTYLIILTIIGWGVGSFFYKPANDQMHPFMVTTIATCMYVILTPLTFFFVKFDKTVTAPGVTFALLGAVMMGIGSLAYYFALKKGGVGEIAAVTSLYPALTLALSMIFFHEDLTWRKGVGIALALVSAVVLSWK
jgi:bacterial/archaeal transporter family protein